MPTDVVMPQMGESIAEGTIVRWIKRVGDRIDRDEPLFEISTDKVDAEVPSPVAGTLLEIKVKAGETVLVNSVVAVIGQAADAAPAQGPEAPQPARGVQSIDGGRPAQAAAPPVGAAAPAPAQTMDAAGRRQKSSPLVRRIAREHNVDLTAIAGSGLGGRVTKHDILAHLEARPATAARPAAPAAPGGVDAPLFKPGESVAVVPMSVMRRKIAEHMILSRRTSAHVYSVFEVNFARVSEIREARTAEFERAGSKLTYLTFIISAVVDALGAMPVLNASIDGETIVYKRDINVGIAVALDWGLIVPVIKNAGEKNLLGLSRAIVDLATRARAKQLKPEEVQGGTFTVTNPGALGAEFGMPIINQPQVAILGVGAVEKRPVVIGDAIAIRPMAYLTLGYDHRLIDGAVADQFMSRVKQQLESFDPATA